MIVCLLVSFNSFSQIDIPKSKDSIIILSENQARKVIKDLIRYDSLKEVHFQLEKHLFLLTEKEKLLLQKLVIKDSIIFTQKKYVDIQEKIINTKKPIQLNGYVGVQTFQVSLIDPLLYFQTELEISKFTIGARVFIQPNKPGGYGFIVEYKIF